MLTATPSCAIETCLDPAAMRPLLQAWLPEAQVGGPIEQVRVTRARRSASRRRNPHPLTLVYQLVLRDGSTRDFYARLQRDGANAEEFANASALCVPPLNLMLWPWPADPGLPQLPALLDAQSALAWHSDAPAAVEVLRYQPEQRATLRYRQGGHGLYAKTFHDDRGQQIHQRFAHFWSLAQQDADAPLVARPLGWQPDTRSVWQAQAPGLPLAQLLGASPARALPDRLARAMLSLHAAELPTPALRDTAHWLKELGRRQRKVARAVPALGGRVARLADAIAYQADALPRPAPCLIHGDFHAGQVAVDGERVVLFDFDEFALGDPMEDLAAFITRLPASAAGFGDALVAAYARQAPQRFSRPALQWHLALQMLLQASRAFVFQVDDWRGALERHLSRAESLCASYWRGLAR